MSESRQWNLSEDIEKTIQRSIVQQTFQSEEDSSSIVLSPQAKKLKQFVELINEKARPEDRNRLLENVHNDYIGNKFAGRELLSCYNGTTANNNGTTLAANNNNNNGTANATSCGTDINTKSSNETFSESPRRGDIYNIDFHHFCKDWKTLDNTDPVQVWDDNHVKGNNNTTKSYTSWIRYPINDSETLCVGQVMDQLGPLMKIKFTTTPESSKYPQQCKDGWCSRQYFCLREECNFRAMITSADMTYSCKNLELFVDGEHNHKAFTWLDYYNHLQERQHRPTGNAITTKDSLMFPQRPGIPNSIVAEIEIEVRANPCIENKQFAVALEMKYTNTTLFKHSHVRKLIKEGVMKKTKDMRKKNQTIPKIKYAIDLYAYKHQYTLDTGKISQMVSPRRVLGDTHLDHYCKLLQNNDLFKGIPFHQDELPQRQMIILDHPSVEKEAAYQAMIQSDGLITGANARGKTVVFTSIASLSNICWCQTLGWEITAAIDGTHGITDRKEILILFGVFHVTVEGTRNFYPVGMCLAEGERKVCAYILIRNIQIACEHLFGIKVTTFRGGAVSDRTSVFVDPLVQLLPGTVSTQCFTHINRKFMRNDMKGNGQYSKYVVKQKKEWLSEKAKEDLRCLHSCYSEQMQQRMSLIIQKKWEAAGEKKLWNTFSTSYLLKSPYNNWYFSVAGIPFGVPCNQPTENCNVLTKGNASMAGIIRMGRKYEAALTVEMPRLVYQFATWNTEPQRNYPVLNIQNALNSEIFMSFYYPKFCFKIDTRDHPGGSKFVNDVLFISQPITDTRVVNFCNTIRGVYNGEDEQEMLLQCTQLHFLHQKKVKIGGIFDNKPETSIWICNCQSYYKKGRCYPSLLLQHHTTLSSIGNSDRVQSKGSSHRQTERQWEHILLRRARKNLSRYKNKESE